MHNNKKLAFGEFVALMAGLMALNALAIDAILPALYQIAFELGSETKNSAQFLISVVFVGLMFGQIIYGPIADAKGRKPTMLASLSIFIFATLISIFATNFYTMLFGRFLQGFGAAGPRIIVLAIVRDLYKGRLMARVMSFTMSIFIFVPVIAPILGEFILYFSHWRGIFLFFIAFALTLALWFSLRQVETLNKEKTRSLSFKFVMSAIFETIKNPISFSYILAMGLIFSGFLTFLTTAQQILQIDYQLGSAFPFYFGALALGVGLASLLNARLVMRFGMRLLSQNAIAFMAIISFAFLPISIYYHGEPPLTYYLAYLALVLFCFGLTFGNLSTLAIEPLGHIAGTASSIIGSLSTLISIPIGVFIGQLYKGNIYPLVIGFALLASLAFIVVVRTNKS